LFDGVWIESLPAEEILSFVDVPCKGDFYFIEKCVYALWTAGGRAFSAEPRSAVAVEALPPESEAISLFNGQDLSAFYTWLVDTKYEDPRRVFSVTKGVLRISGEGLGYMATRNSHSNYRLVVEFVGSRNGHGGSDWKARDSGLFLHSIVDGTATSGCIQAAIECNLFEGATGDLCSSAVTPRHHCFRPSHGEAAVERDANGWPSEAGGKRETLNAGLSMVRGAGNGRIDWLRPMMSKSLWENEPGRMPLNSSHPDQA
jgi:hypothetical protein